MTDVRSVADAVTSLTTRTAEGVTTIASGEHPEASATVAVHEDSVQICFTVNAGHQSPALRPMLVDAVFTRPDVTRAAHLHVSVPLGDVQLLELVRARCSVHAVRAAGGTCLVEATQRC